MKRIAWYAKRNLCGASERSGAEPRGCYDFALSPRPDWWTPVWDNRVGSVGGEVYLVYENVVGRSVDAVAACQHAVVVLGNDECWSLRYADISSIEFPSKEPVARSLSVHAADGSIVRLPACRPVGISFGMFNYLSYAAGWYKRKGDV